MIAPVKVLVVDDESNLRTLVRSYLEAEGFEVTEAGDGAAAVAAVRQRSPDLVVMDIRMPGLDGVEALREMRTFSDVPVIMLTARSEEADKLIGLSVGADDYITKPFSPRELVARVKAHLRRSRAGRTQQDDDVMRFGEIEIDSSRRLVSKGETTFEFSALEFDLLAMLASQPRRVFSRRQLLEAVWGWDYIGDERVVDVHIRSLRKILSDDALHPTVIGTVRGVGYRFIPERI